MLTIVGLRATPGHDTAEACFKTADILAQSQLDVLLINLTNIRPDFVDVAPTAFVRVLEDREISIIDCIVDTKNPNLHYAELGVSLEHTNQLLQNFTEVEAELVLASHLLLLDLDIIIIASDPLPNNRVGKMVSTPADLVVPMVGRPTTVIQTALGLHSKQKTPGCVYLKDASVTDRIDFPAINMEDFDEFSVIRLLGKTLASRPSF